MNNKEAILKQMEDLDIFNTTKYTYAEYVSNLKRFESYMLSKAFGENHSSQLRMDDAIYKFRERAINSDIDNEVIYAGTRALKETERQLSISASGKNAEDYVSNHLSRHVGREDFTSYRGIDLCDDEDNTELDNLILTRNGFLLLEVKNIKSNAVIDQNGRLVINGCTSYDKIPLVESMKLKRRLFRKTLQKILSEMNSDIDIQLDSYIVFNTPRNSNFRVTNNSNEKHCTVKKLSYLVNDFDAGVTYAEDEMELLRGILSKLECNKKAFDPDIDIAKIKEDTSTLISSIEAAELKKRREQTLNNKNRNKVWLAADTYGLVAGGLLGLALVLKVTSFNKFKF